MVQANYSFIKKIFRKSINISCGCFLFNALTLCLQVPSADNLRKQYVWPDLDQNCLTL